MTDETDQPGDAEALEGVEIIDASIVSSESGVLEPVRAVPVPARQAAALAATGFMAGAATVAVVSRRRHKPSRRRKRKKGALGEIVGSNSFLVDVHLLKRD